MTQKQIQNYERMFSKPWSKFTDSEKLQCEKYERERTVKPKGEKRLKRERSSWHREASYQVK